MKKVSIKYNPYLISTQITIEGHELKGNSSLRFEKLRLQEWADKLPELLVKECKDKNYQIEFTGTHADYEDLRLAFELRNDTISSTFIHNATMDVSKVEEEVDNIFKTILDGPIAELQNQELIESFQKAKNKEFEVNVIATMSAGKSTLINAMLGKQLMPARVEATTATVVKIINAKQDNYSLKAFDNEGYELSQYYLENATPEQIDELNDNPDVVTMEITGRIPFVDTVGMQLVLIDTPGPNNARNRTHQKLTYEMLEDSDKSLVLYVINGELLGINDNEMLLDYVCECMRRGGKQSRDRYLFVVNKLDVWKLKEADRIKIKLTEERENLEKRGIYNPCLFPVSSLAALELRTDEEDIEALGKFANRATQSPCYHFENYYEFNRLPKVVENRLQSILVKGDTRDGIEIHTGIVSIEQAISLYVNKYARTTKIKDLVDSFNYRLNELATMENLRKAIREDQGKKASIETQIAFIKEKLHAAKEAQTCSTLIESLDLTKSLSKTVRDSTKEVLSSITTIISSNKETKVELSKAKETCKIIDKEFDAVTIKLQVKIDNIIKKTYDDAISQMIKEYTGYLDQLNIMTSTEDFSFKPSSLVSDELHKLNLEDTNTLIDKYKTAPIDEGHEETVTRKKTIEGNRSRTAIGGTILGTGIAAIAFAADCLGGCGLFSALAAGAGLGLGGGLAAGRGSSEVDVPVKVWKSKMVTYVNMSDLVTNYFMPRQIAINKLPDSVIKYVGKETSELKKKLSDRMDEINDLINSKLNELEASMNENEQTSEKIRSNEQKVEWLEDIQKRVNELILF